MGPWFPGDWPEEELGWTIWTEEAEGQGYAFEAVTALRRHAYEISAGAPRSPTSTRRTPARSALAQRLGCQIDARDAAAAGQSHRPGQRDRGLHDATPHQDVTGVYGLPAWFRPRTGGPDMTDATARAAELLKGHRESIDRLDAILVYTLGERFKHTQAVGKLKAEHDLPPSDPAREAAQIARLEDLAKRADLDPEFAKKFLNFIIAEVIQHHKQHQS
jgi:chorismate mutase